MKSFFWGIVYTVFVAFMLSGFSGCIDAKLLTGEISENVILDTSENMTDCDDYVLTTGSVNLRLGAGADFEKIATVPNGTVVHRIGICENGWILVEVKDKTGYLSGKYYTEDFEITDGDVSQVVSADRNEDKDSYATPTEKVIKPTATPVAKRVTSTPKKSEEAGNATHAPSLTLLPTDALKDPDTDINQTSGTDTDKNSGTNTDESTGTDLSGANDTGSESNQDTNIDDVDAFLETINHENNIVNIASAADFYYENEKEATAAFVKYAYGYTTFSMLYDNAGCMHTPEYFMEMFPELYSVEIDYEKSKVYKNAIYVVYNTIGKEGGKYAYAIRTGDVSLLSDEETWAIKRIKVLSTEILTEEMTDVEKILTVHDYIINNTKYDSGYADESHTPYGLLKNGLAVCDGYSDTFLIFMLLSDIECQSVTGYANENHAWNQVCIDNTWYNIDVTWDDPVTTDNSTGSRIDTIRYTYFLVNDEILSKTHEATCGYEEDCTSDKYHMYMYDGYYCGTEEEIRKSIEAQLSNESIYLCYAKGMFTRDKIIKIFQSMHNVSVTSYAPSEVRDGIYMFEIINPLL